MFDTNGIRHTLGNIRELAGDRSAISETTGGVIMLAIVLVIGAVVGAFAFGYVDSLSQNAPQAVTEFSYTDTGTGELTLSHTGGATITPENTGQLVVSGQATDSDNIDMAAGTVTWPAAVDTNIGNGETVGVTGTITAGDIIYKNTDVDSTGLESGDTVTLTWVSNDESQSNQMTTYTVPG